MNLFLKKILAKYVVYVEVLGYGLVLVFIGMLFALSYIKAEDDLVDLKGDLEIKTDLIRSSQKQIILDIAANGKTVRSGDILAHVSADRKLIADSLLKSTLEIQINTAEGISERNLVERFTGILTELKSRSYPEAKIVKIKSEYSGEFFLNGRPNDIVLDNAVIGGIFNFHGAAILVSGDSVDRQQKRKLKSGQRGTARVDLGFEQRISFPITMVAYSSDQMVFKPESLSIEHKQRIAEFLFRHPEIDKLPANISVKVGTKSWMNLILQ